MTPPEDSLEEAMLKLYTAKWNIPQAVTFLGRRACKEEWERMKEEFKCYCSLHPAKPYQDWGPTEGSSVT